VAAGDWVEAPLYAKVDEASASDADFISATGTTHCELALSSLSEPGTGDVTIRVRYRKAAGAADSTLTATLVEGTTVIATEEFSVTSTSWTTGSFVLTSGEVASITDWTNLRVRLDYAASSEVTLGGVGSTSTSLTTYPKIDNTTTGDWYVDGSVGSSGDGTSLGTAFKTIAEGLSALSAGETLLVKGGTYTLGSGGITRSTSWGSKTYIMGYGTDRPILDATSVGTNNSALTLDGSVNEVWHRFHVKNVPSAGGGNNGQSIRLVTSANNNILSDIWSSHNITDGFYAFDADNNILQDCASWRLGDGVATDTNCPDNYAIKGASSGNKLVRCFGGHGPDDNFDFWDGNGNDVIDCVAYKGGYYWSGASGSASSGDACGFKMSGSSTTTPNHVTGSIAIACRADGLQSNQADLAFNYTRCTTVLNEGLGADFNGDDTGMTGTATDCISLNNTGTGNQGATYSVYAGTYYTTTYCNWDLSISDPSFYDTANYDWSLAAGSSAIGAGISGGNLGASDVALKIAKEWLAKDLT
jgi:hypothetical protein